MVEAVTVDSAPAAGEEKKPPRRSVSSSSSSSDDDRDKRRRPASRRSRSGSKSARRRSRSSSASSSSSRSSRSSSSSSSSRSRSRSRSRNRRRRSASSSSSSSSAPSPRKTSEVSAAKRKVYVARLSQNVTKEALREIFSCYGKVVSIDIPPDRQNPVLHRAFAYVEMETVEAAREAIEGLNNGLIDGKVVSVTEMDENLAGNRMSPRRGNGGFRGERRRSPPRRRSRSPLRKRSRSRSPRRSRSRGRGARYTRRGRSSSSSD